MDIDFRYPGMKDAIDPKQITATTPAVIKMVLPRPPLPYTIVCGFCGRSTVAAVPGTYECSCHREQVIVQQHPRLI